MKLYEFQGARLDPNCSSLKWPKPQSGSFSGAALRLCTSVRRSLRIALALLLRTLSPTKLLCAWPGGIGKTEGAAAAKVARIGKDIQVYSSTLKFST